MRLFGLLMILSFACCTAFGSTEEIISLILKTPKTSKAVIKRGKSLIEVDLASAPKIQDYDVLLLEDGVYSTLGNFTAKYVRVIGNGQRRTFISSIAKGSSPFLVNSTELWDVTVADAHFKVSDLNGLWAVNSEFVGSILVSPAALDKSPAFAIRTIFSDVSKSDVPTTADSVFAHFLPQKDAKVYPEAPKLLAMEDEIDRKEDMNLKVRSAMKGLIARGMNYLYQKDVLKPSYDITKYNQLVKNARSAKAKGHHYVAMLSFAEADRLSGHSRFDEILKEITPLNQIVSKDCGCTVEGQGLASTVKAEIENNLYAKIPITALPGQCKIQALHVSKGTSVANARLQAQLEKATFYKSREHAFQETMLAHTGGKTTPGEEDFAVGSPAEAPAKEYTVVADVDMPGVKKSYSSDKGKSVNQNIVEPISESILDKLAANIKAAKAKIASSDLVAKVDGLIAQALYGDDPARQSEYESLHEQQFGRKVSSEGAMGSVFAY